MPLQTMISAPQAGIVQPPQVPDPFTNVHTGGLHAVGGSGGGLSTLMRLMQFANSVANAQQQQAIRDITLAKMRDFEQRGWTDRERRAYDEQQRINNAVDSLLNNADFMGKYEEALQSHPHKRKQMFADLRSNYVNPTKDIYGANPSTVYKALFAQNEAAMNRELRDIDDVSSARILWDKWRTDANSLWNAVKNVLPWTDSEALARDSAQYEQQVNEANPYLRDQARQAQEGESWWDRTTSGGKLLDVLGGIPTLAAFLAPGGAVRGAAAGAARLGAALNPATVARAAAGANIAGGGILGTSLASQGFTQSVQGMGLPPEQEKAALNSGESLINKIIGGVTGAIAPSIATPYNALRGTATKSLVAASRRTAGENALRAAGDVAAGMGIMSGVQAGATEGLTQSATGQPIDISLRNVRDAAIQGALTGGLLGGITGRRSIPRLTQDGRVAAPVESFVESFRQAATPEEQVRVLKAFSYEYADENGKVDSSVFDQLPALLELPGGKIPKAMKAQMRDVYEGRADELKPVPYADDNPMPADVQAVYEAGVQAGAPEVEQFFAMDFEDQTAAIDALRDRGLTQPLSDEDMRLLKSAQKAKNPRVEDFFNKDVDERNAVLEELRGTSPEQTLADELESVATQAENAARNSSVLSDIAIQLTAMGNTEAAQHIQQQIGGLAGRPTEEQDAIVNAAYGALRSAQTEAKPVVQELSREDRLDVMRKHIREARRLKEDEPLGKAAFTYADGLLSTIQTRDADAATIAKIWLNRFGVDTSTMSTDEVFTRAEGMFTEMARDLDPTTRIASERENALAHEQKEGAALPKILAPNAQVSQKVLYGKLRKYIADRTQSAAKQWGLDAKEANAQARHELWATINALDPDGRAAQAMEHMYWTDELARMVGANPRLNGEELLRQLSAKSTKTPDMAQRAIESWISDVARVARSKVNGDPSELGVVIENFLKTSQPTGEKPFPFLYSSKNESPDIVFADLINKIQAERILNGEQTQGVQDAQQNAKGVTGGVNTATDGGRTTNTESSRTSTGQGNSQGTATDNGTTASGKPARATTQNKRANAADTGADKGTRAGQRAAATETGSDTVARDSGTRESNVAEQREPGDVEREEGVSGGSDTSVSVDTVNRMREAFNVTTDTKGRVDTVDTLSKWFSEDWGGNVLDGSVGNTIRPMSNAEAYMRLLDPVDIDTKEARAESSRLHKMTQRGAADLSYEFDKAFKALFTSVLAESRPEVSSKFKQAAIEGASKPITRQLAARMQQMGLRLDDEALFNRIDSYVGSEDVEGDAYREASADTKVELLADNADAFFRDAGELREEAESPENCAV